MDFCLTKRRCRKCDAPSRAVSHHSNPAIFAASAMMVRMGGLPMTRGRMVASATSDGRPDG